MASKTGQEDDTKRIADENLQRESKTLIEQFQRLCLILTESLKKMNVSVPEMRDMVRRGSTHCVRGVNYDQDPSLFWQLFPELTNTRTIDDIMSHVVNCCSFMSFQMLESIISIKGTEQDKSELVKYKENLHAYSQKHVLECRLEVSKRREGHMNMIIKLDQTCKKWNIGKLIQVIQRILHTMKYPFAIKLFCLEFNEQYLITFQLPFHVLQYIFPLSREQNQLLQREHVEHLVLNCNHTICGSSIGM